MSIAIFFGSTSGNTERIAEMIKAEMGERVTYMADVMDAAPSELLDYDVLILGISTWDLGDLQADWDDFVPQLKDMDFTGKTIALFGCGDCDTYGKYFLDALGLLWKEFQKLGEPKLIGVWPTESYSFEASQALYDDHHFVGLGLDEDNQPELHEERVKAWTAQLQRELGL